MANIDFLIHNSTKKILKLVKNLPDSEKLEAALKQSTHAHSPVGARAAKSKRRFNKHPRNFNENDLIDEDDNATASSQIDKEDVVMIKNPTATFGSQSPERNDSSDEFCDVTLRTETTTDYSMTLSKHLQQKECSHRNECSSLSTKHGDSKTDSRTDSKSRTVLPGRKQTTPVDKDKRGTTGPSSREASRSEKPSRVDKLPKIDKGERVDKQDKETREHGVHKSKEGKRVEPTESAEKIEEELKVYLDPKLKSMVERSTVALKECRLIFEEGVDPPDGQEDCDRRKKRTYEFASRFARNYLYQLNRITLDIEGLINPPPSAKSSNKTADSFLLAQRFYNAYQTVYAALDAYLKHLPTGLVNGMPEKFRDLLESIMKLTSLFRSVNDKDYSTDKETVVDIFDVYCHSMLLDDGLIPQSLRESTSNLSLNKRHSSKNSQQSSRLSMYHVPLRKDVYWKKAVAALAKKKYEVPSKYKTATFKHRPPPLPPQAQPPPLKLGLGAKKFPPQESREKKKCKSAKFGILDMDNNVSTFVQETDSRSKSLSTKHLGHGEAAMSQSPVPVYLRRHAQGFFENVTKGDQEMTAMEYDCILDHFLEIIGEDIQPEAPSKEIETQRLLESKFCKPMEEMNFQEFLHNLVECANAKDEYVPPKQTVVKNTIKKKEAKGKSTTISVTGPNNAKLFCVKDASQSASESRHDLPSQLQQIDPDGHLRHRLSGLTICPEEDSSELIYKERDAAELEEAARMTMLEKTGVKKKNRQEPLPHVRVRKATPLSMLPKQVMLNIIEYKLIYHKKAKKNYMYRKSEDVTPWLLVERVADTLLEETLLTITRDIQVDKILKKIYAQEFK